MSDILELLSDEADLCRNDGAEDIAILLHEAAAEIETLRAALLAERERCAKVAESIISADQYDTMDTDCYQDTADRIAAAIRNLQEPTQ